MRMQPKVPDDNKSVLLANIDLVKMLAKAVKCDDIGAYIYYKGKIDSVKLDNKEKGLVTIVLAGISISKTPFIARYHSYLQESKKAGQVEKVGLARGLKLMAEVRDALLYKQYGLIYQYQHQTFHPYEKSILLKHIAGVEKMIELASEKFNTLADYNKFIIFFARMFGQSYEYITKALEIYGSSNDEVSTRLNRSFGNFQKSIIDKILKVHPDLKVYFPARQLKSLEKSLKKSKKFIESLEIFNTRLQDCLEEKSSASPEIKALIEKRIQLFSQELERSKHSHVERVSSEFVKQVSGAVKLAESKSLPGLQSFDAAKKMNRMANLDDNYYRRVESLFSALISFIRCCNRELPKIQKSAAASQKEEVKLDAVVFFQQPKNNKMEKRQGKVFQAIKPFDVKKALKKVENKNQLFLKEYLKHRIDLLVRIYNGQSVTYQEFDAFVEYVKGSVDNSTSGSLVTYSFPDYRVDGQENAVILKIHRQHGSDNAAKIEAGRLLSIQEKLYQAGLSAQQIWPEEFPAAEVVADSKEEVAAEIWPKGLKRAEGIFYMFYLKDIRDLEIPAAVRKEIIIESNKAYIPKDLIRSDGDVLKGLTDIGIAHDFLSQVRAYYGAMEERVESQALLKPK